MRARMDCIHKLVGGAGAGRIYREFVSMGTAGEVAAV